MVMAAPASAQQQPDNYLSSPARFSAALAKLLARVGDAPQVSNLTVRRDSITLVTQNRDVAWHSDEWSISRVRLGPLSFDSLGGPRPHEGRGIVKREETAFFALDDLALTELDAVIDAAIARAALAGTPTVSAVTIERSLSILPTPAYGAVRWTVSLETPRESATVYADAAGNIYAADLSNTDRARRLDLLAQDDWPMQQAQAELTAALGDAAVVHELRVYNSYLFLEAEHPSDPKLIRDYSWDYSGARSSPPDTPNLLAMGMGDYQPFALSELDLALLPDIKAAAVEAFGAPGAVVTYVSAEKPTDRVAAPRVLWQVDLRQPDGEEGRVTVSTTGEVLEVSLPESRRVAVDWLAPATLVSTLARLEQALGREARFLDIHINDRAAIVQVEDPQQPGAIVEVIVDAEQITRRGEPIMPWDKSADDGRMFTLADLAPLDEMLFAELASRTLEAMALEGAEVFRYTISRTPFMFDAGGKVFVEVRAGKDDGWTSGRVSYDLEGTALDVVTP